MNKSVAPLDENSLKVELPGVPAVNVLLGKVHVLTPEGEIQSLNPEQAKMVLHGQQVMVCHAPFVRSRIGIDEIYAFDLLELFAFVYPGRFCVPTPQGVAKAIGIDGDLDAEDVPMLIPECAAAMLGDLAKQKNHDKILSIAAVMGLQGKGWPWTPYVFSALGQEYSVDAAVSGRSALNVWKKLSEWAEDAPEPPPAHHAVSGEEARERLGKILGADNEARPQQMEFASVVSNAFCPVSSRSDDKPRVPHVVLAEAGTGIGKTLGYLAPASVWCEKNDGTVWISTFTRNLQRQIEDELDRLYPTRELKDSRVAVRKGRENYLCLLNFEEAAAAAGLARHPSQAIAAGIMSRWIGVSKDGDLNGGDFPGWLPGLVGYSGTMSLSDRRGECIYGACDHYHRCFVEKSVRKARHASIVVANHALVMRLAADSGETSDLPGRFVFDEGHHLFDAADSAYAGHLTAIETRDMRRWLLGAEGGRRSRAKGLQRRLEDLLEGDDRSQACLWSVQEAARGLSADGWSKRMKSGMSSGPAEKFLFQVYGQVYSRDDGRNGPYSLETHTFPLADGVLDAAGELKKTLSQLYRPMNDLGKRINERLVEDNGEISPDTRRRMDAVCTSLRLKLMTLSSWVSMLETLESGEKPEEFIDWMGIERIEGKAIDVGLYRHYVDPMRPFAGSMQPHLHGMAVTSATMRDSSGDEDEDWNVARERTGVNYLTSSPVYLAETSPFDYVKNSKVMIVGDVNKRDSAQVAGAYRALFEASGGGALGLFTAIQRLRDVRARIFSHLEMCGLPLYSQHVDDINTGALVDIFREDVNACLLGTDAVRDGIDVPGGSMRLLVYDRVPWPRPTILHKARRKNFGSRRYDEMITRLRIRQAFGRLIRRSSDRGVFVMLDGMLPTRLLGAFPEGVPVHRTGLADAVATVREFVGNTDG